MSASEALYQSSHVYVLSQANAVAQQFLSADISGYETIYRNQLLFSNFNTTKSIFNKPDHPFFQKINNLQDKSL